MLYSNVIQPKTNVYSLMWCPYNKGSALPVTLLVSDLLKTEWDRGILIIPDRFHRLHTILLV